jgi:RNA polymerase-interacting CarD/CdnL/TRCF family regulator
MNKTTLHSGEQVYHPRFGFGVIKNLSRRQSIDAATDGASAGHEDYYDIGLREGGTLLVPVARAHSLGLRPLTNSLEDIKAYLRSPAGDLPQRGRERASELRAREQAAEPSALARAVRDLAAQGREHRLSNSEKTWMDRACERLSTEAALVDHISIPEARAAIHEVIACLVGD